MSTLTLGLSKNWFQHGNGNGEVFTFTQNCRPKKVVKILDTVINRISVQFVWYFPLFLRRNCLFHDATEGLMMELIGVGGRSTQFLVDLRVKE